MQDIPFFPKLVIYFPMVAGVIMVLFSFSEKQHSSWKENFGDKAANKIRMFFRYGGPVMVLIGIFQYLIKDL